MSLIVELGSRSYEICIHPGCIEDLASQLNDVPVSQFVLIADEQVAQLYGQRVSHQLQASSEVLELTIPVGESSKSLSEATRLWNSLLEHKVDRNALVVALGGGVTGDLAGFVAATFMRGIRFVQIPTTLLAQVDSSVGGKVGINLPAAKNIVGHFWQPTKVIIDPQVLSTLEQRHLNAGMAEVIKYGVIMNPDLFSTIEENSNAIQQLDPQILGDLIHRCCVDKAQVVKEDETESSGRRMILNYGHTFGHAIEKVCGYGEYLHGEAIAIGMHCAARLQNQLGKLDGEIVERQRVLFEQFNLPTAVPAGISEELLDAMRLDKKSSRGNIRLILPTRIGEVEIVDKIDDKTILSVLS